MYFRSHPSSVCDLEYCYHFAMFIICPRRKLGWPQSQLTLVELEQSGLGVRMGNIFCGTPMYTDDLALIASSPEGPRVFSGLQAPPHLTGPHQLGMVLLFCSQLCWN